MKLPLSLLKSYLPQLRPVAEIAETLTLLGIEVDAVHAATPPFTGVVVAEVRAVRPHPGANNLRIAEVFDGTKSYEIVCGAPNCRAGLRTAFARAGSTLCDTAGKTHKIEPTSIRGVASAGMLCSASELGLYDDDAGILELPTEFALGADAAGLLWDPVLEISLTPNLGHCMSALGVARELAAAWQVPLQLRAPSGKKGPSVIPAKVDAAMCPRYMTQKIEGVRVGPSPFWLQRQMRAAGLRPRNNIVDVSNYMLLKTGQPTHAFDLDTLRGPAIRVMLSERPLKFAGLDGKTYDVPVGTLLICDAERAIALAGILGGAETAVSDGTTRILLEAPAFDPLVVRKRAKQMGLRTDAALRFEKGVDPVGVEAALEEAVALILETAGGKAEAGRVDCRADVSPRQIACRPARVNHVLGTKLSQHEMASIFQRLGCVVQERESQLLVGVPPYRMDLAEEIDLVEEVARLYGYNHIELRPPRASSPKIPPDPAYLFETHLRQRLVGAGLQELLNCDLISPKMLESAPELAAQRATLRVLHAKSEEYSVLRPSLLPGILQVLKRNQDQKSGDVRAFELGRIHVAQNGKPVEPLCLSLVLSGTTAPQHWSHAERDIDFFDLKGLLENLLSGLKFTPSDHPTFHPGRQVNVIVSERCIGTAGELHPALLAKLDLKQRVYYAELDASVLQGLWGGIARCAPLPQFPSSERDWTLPLGEMLVDQVLTAIRSVHCPLLERFELTDLYTGEGKRNATLRFVYRDLLKTVAFEEVEAAHTKLIQEVLAKTSPPR